MDLRAALLSQDLIYVGGGNTANMLAIWRVHGVDEILREAWENGVILCGGSAGAICWFESSVTDSFGRQLAPLHDGLGLLPGSFCPHYDGDILRRPVYQKLVSQGELPPGNAADDGVAVRYSNTEISEIVADSPNGRAWRVEQSVDVGVDETKIAARFLG